LPIISIIRRVYADLATHIFNHIQTYQTTTHKSQLIKYCRQKVQSKLTYTQLENFAVL